MESETACGAIACLVEMKYTTFEFQNDFCKMNLYKPHNYYTIIIKISLICVD